MKKIYLLLAISSVFIACSNTNLDNQNSTSEEKHVYNLLEEKREFYKKRDEEEAKKRAELAEQKRLEEEKLAKEKERIEKEKLEEQKRLERERMKNMTPEEKLELYMQKAREEVNKMLETAHGARQEEIDNDEAVKELEKTFNDIK